MTKHLFAPWAYLGALGLSGCAPELAHDDVSAPLRLAAITDPGYPDLPRFDADVNGDGLVDYCRFVGNKPQVFLSCALRSKAGFEPANQNAFNSVRGIDVGYPDLPRALVDVNGDKLLDYCRFVGSKPAVFLSCNLATARGFDAEQHGFTSEKGIDPGYANRTRRLVDVTQDGRADFCRFVGNAPDVYETCLVADADGFVREWRPDGKALAARWYRLECGCTRPPLPAVGQVCLDWVDAYGGPDKAAQFLCEYYCDGLPQPAEVRTASLGTPGDVCAKTPDNQWL